MDILKALIIIPTIITILIACVIAAVWFAYIIVGISIIAIVSFIVWLILEQNRYDEDDGRGLR